VVTRWGDNAGPACAKAFNLLLGTLRGSVCVYQGEELGLSEADIAFEDLQDPYGMNFWPVFKGRDGCRTPMPWNSKIPNADFSRSKPWLPIADDHQKAAVDVQEMNQISVLNAYREFLSWRKQNTVLITGDIEFIETKEPILAFRRFDKNTELHVYINLSNKPQSHPLSGSEKYSIETSIGADLAVLSDKKIQFSPYSVLIARQNT
jgi:alpha-glucosidase